MAAVYDCKAYVDKALDVDELDVHISFFAHKGDLSISAIFVIPKVPDEVWVAKEDILCIVLRGKGEKLVLDKTVLETILKMLEAWV